MRALEVSWHFLVDLVVGDDPKVAVAVVLALVVAGVLLLLGAGPTVVTGVGALAIIVAFTVSLLLDVRKSAG